MIDEVDESIKALIRRDALNGGDVELAFEAPTTDWAARRTKPTVNVYLYDIHEDTARRRAGEHDVVDDGGVVIRHQPPPRWFKLSYFVTAWTQRPEDEHRLLSALLRCWLRYDALPAEVRHGALATAPDPVLVEVAMPASEDGAAADIWSALGGELKPSLNLVLTVAVDTGRGTPAAPLVEEPPVVALTAHGIGTERVVGARRRAMVRRVPQG